MRVLFGAAGTAQESAQLAPDVEYSPFSRVPGRWTVRGPSGSARVGRGGARLAVGLTDQWPHRVEPSSRGDRVMARSRRPTSHGVAGGGPAGFPAGGGAATGTA